MERRYRTRSSLQPKAGAPNEGGSIPIMTESGVRWFDELGRAVGQSSCTRERGRKRARFVCARPLILYIVRTGSTGVRFRFECIFLLFFFLG